MENEKPVITGINAFAPKNVRAIFRSQKAAFKEAIQSKENFKAYLRTPGSDNNSYSWVNEGISPVTLVPLRT
jgi:hypothetical protein